MEWENVSVVEKLFQPRHELLLRPGENWLAHRRLKPSLVAKNNFSSFIDSWHENPGQSNEVVAELETGMDLELKKKTCVETPAI